MKTKNTRIKPEHAKRLGLKISPGGAYRITEEQYRELQQIRQEGKSSANNNDCPREVLTAKANDGRLMDIDEYCDFYNIPREYVKSYKLVTHTGVPYYNIQSTQVEIKDEYDMSLEEIKNLLRQDIKYTPLKREKEGRIIVVSLADLHIGAYVDNLVKTKSFSIGTVIELLEQSVLLINEYNAKEVHIRLLGDLIESFTGLNHKNSWKGLQKGMIGAEVVKFATKILHDHFLSKIVNLKGVSIIAGNHDRVTSSKDEDTDGDAANLIAWGLELIGYNVKFNPFVLSEYIDGINYIDLHGHDFISRKSTKDICWDYGMQGVFNFIREGHLHSIIEKLSVTQVSKFQTIKDDAIDHRRMNIPSFFTGNSFSERLGYTSNSGFIVSYNNGKGIPNVDFKAL